MSLVGRADELRDAHRLIRPYIHRTPILTSATLDRLSGRSLFFKCENFQRVGAFKARGAFHALLKLSAEEKKHGVVTHSSGNHGQAIALAGRTLDIPTTVVVPRNAPKVKRDAMRDYGATLVLCEPTQAARESMVRDLVLAHHYVEIPPFDHDDVILGQGTAALELLEDVPLLDAVIAPVGGGGLLAGCAIAASLYGAHVLGAEPAQADDTKRSLDAGKRITLDAVNTIADGVRTSVGVRNFAIIAQGVSDVICIEENEIVNAMRLLWERMKIVVEPTAALPLAAVLKTSIDVTGQRVGLIVSGGNVDVDAFFQTALSA